MKEKIQRIIHDKLRRDYPLISDWMVWHLAEAIMEVVKCECGGECERGAQKKNHEGPEILMRHTCEGCCYLVENREQYKFCFHSSYLLERLIGYEYWTPLWCPMLDSTGNVGECERGDR